MKMGWKNWPSWLKGGVIGAGIAILIMILMILLSDILHSLSYENQFYWTLSMFHTFLQNLFTPIFLIIMLLFGYDEHDARMFISFIIFPIVLFLIFALIGWIYGKIKSKSKKK